MSEAAPDLETVIRAKLAAGALPSAKPETVWAGKGTGQPCTACGRAIAADDIECELDFSGGRAGVRLHKRCVVIWDRLRDEFRTRADERERGA
jgi:hypothetical protein